MRTVLLGSLLMLLGASCASDADPIVQRCESACKVETSTPCASHKDDCVKECRAFATQAQNFGGTKCYQCVADSYEYVIVNGVCGGGGTVYFTHKTPLDTQCVTSCVKPDGSVVGF